MTYSFERKSVVVSYYNGYGTRAQSLVENPIILYVAVHSFGCTIILMHYHTTLVVTVPPLQHGRNVVPFQTGRGQRRFCQSKRLEMMGKLTTTHSDAFVTIGRRRIEFVLLLFAIEVC